MIQKLLIFLRNAPPEERERIGARQSAKAMQTRCWKFEEDDEGDAEKSDDDAHERLKRCVWL